MDVFLQLGAAASADLQKNTSNLENNRNTLRVLPKLLALNECGFVTFNSQVGSLEPTERKRAYVDGFIHRTVWPYMLQMMMETEFLVMARSYTSSPSRQDKENMRLPVTVDVTQHPPYMNSSTTLTPWPWEDGEINIPKRAISLLRANPLMKQDFEEEGLIVSVLDPVWGRESALIDTLCRYMKRWRRRVSHNLTSVPWNSTRN